MSKTTLQIMLAADRNEHLQLDLSTEFYLTPEIPTYAQALASCIEFELAVHGEVDLADDEYHHIDGYCMNDALRRLESES